MGEFLIYQAEDGKTQLSVVLENEDVWLTPKHLTELFGKAKGTISEHIKHIFEDGELADVSVVRFLRTTATDGKSYEVAHYTWTWCWPWATATYVGSQNETAL